MKLTGNHILLVILAVLLLGSIVSADSEYCSPSHGTNVLLDHQGGWYNFTITSPNCYVCVDNGAGYGDVECTACVLSSFTSNVTCGIVPFQVQFNDTSTSGTDITGYYWDFAINNTTVKNPVQWYNLTGMYGVDHSATDLFNTTWTNKSNYITARAPGDTCFGGGGGGTSSGQTQTGGEMMWLVFGLVGGLVGLLVLSRR